MKVRYQYTDPINGDEDADAVYDVADLPCAKVEPLMRLLDSEVVDAVTVVLNYPASITLTKVPDEPIVTPGAASALAALAGSNPS